MARSVEISWVSDSDHIDNTDTFPITSATKLYPCRSQHNTEIGRCCIEISHQSTSISNLRQAMSAHGHSAENVTSGVTSTIVLKIRYDQYNPTDPFTRTHYLLVQISENAPTSKDSPRREITATVSIESKRNNNQKRH